ncbi:MAG: MATE family efflux transporter [Spirochaetaceae bacterium]|jgi:putative MATE family efflux protein|nr:MATE family efflux transporter [Spirochaetaceae bacterium]
MQNETEKTDLPGGASGRLGTEPVGKLLLSFSIPAITGMVLNALYNVVDRIFVGRGVGEIALGGLSLAAPLMTITMSFAMLFGIGAANMISMRLGQRLKTDAQRALSHGFWLLIASSAVIIAVEALLFDVIFSLLGAQEGSLALEYARRYYRIILGGSTFFMISFGLSHCARAQGFPMISMAGMIIGAVTNTILDPLFIFVFKWNVEGAAWATLISWVLSSAFVFYFCAGRKAEIRLRFRKPLIVKPSFDIIKNITAFGSAQFLLQAAMAFVQLLFNYSMGWYGAAALGTARGGDIAQSSMNIVQTILMLILMPVFGINQGAQPVLGFNYGAKRFDRVKKAFRDASLAATAICVLGFLAVMAFPDSLTRLFAPSGSRELLRITPWALRAVCITLPLNGFSIVASNMFVVTGRPKTSILLSLTRQVIALIPLMIVFGRVWGLYGVIVSMPISDAFAFALTGVLVGLEIKKMAAYERAV